MGEEGKKVVVVCKTGCKMKSIGKIVIVSSIFIYAGCSTTKKLLYKDDWEGRYTLVEYNCCGDTATKVRLSIIREENDSYSWRMFFEDGQTDTIAGKAKYIRNKLKFFVTNPEVAGKYFVEMVSAGSPVFWMEYHDQGDYYTWWYNEMNNYRRGKMIFAGINYHFKKRTRY